jgi:solute carrier family 25, member 39/40
VSNKAEFCVAGPIGTITAHAPNKSIAACAAEETRRKTFNSTFDGLRKIARNEGPLTLWRGLSPTLVMAIPANVIYFAGYDWLRYSRQSPFVQMPVSETYLPLLAGSSARVLAAIAVNPIEMFRTRMQAASATTDSSPGGHITKTFQGVKEMIGIRGYRSLWTGLTLTLWRDVPFSAIYWWGYESGRQYLRDYRLAKLHFGSDLELERARARSSSPLKQLQSETHSQILFDSFVAGAVSGAVAALVTTPFDVGKTRQQTVRYAKSATQSAGSAKRTLPEELSMPRFLWHIFKTEGANGLFRGWAARCLKVAPACAIMISSYEIGKKMAGGMNDGKTTGKNPV